MAAGLEPGDRVGIWAPNIAEWVFAALGALGAGGVLVPLNTRFKGAEAAYVLGRSGARFLCTVNGFLGTDYVAMLRDAGGARRHSSTSSCCTATRPTAPRRSPTSSRVPARSPSTDAHARADAVGPDDLSDIIFTSGTTGKPKGAMTHARADAAHVRRVGEHRRPGATATATSW